MNADGTVCCAAYSSECLACSEGVDVETWYKKHQEFEGPGCEPAAICCQAYQAECMACAEGVKDVVAWCKAHKDFAGTGCDDASLNPQIDCKTCPQGFNDGCNRCGCDSAGQTMCTEMACVTVGKPFCIHEKPDDTFCCQGLYADCMACEAGQDPLTFCLEKANLGVDGCEVYHESKPDETSVGGGCCKAFTVKFSSQACKYI